MEISYFQQPELSDSGLAARAGGKIGFYVGFPIQFVLCNIITTITNWDTEIVHYLLLDLARTPIRSRFLCGSESHLGLVSLLEVGWDSSGPRYEDTSKKKLFTR